MKIYFVSGFLGSGKTSWIKDFLSKQNNKKSYLVLENDFGDINFDEIILSNDNIQIESLSSGCICCNISQDFIRTLNEIENRLNPETVIVEPSGVAMLSELKEKIDNDYEIHSITILDGSSWKIGLDNYGEYYEDQIKAADLVLVNRADDFSINDLEMEFPTVKFYLEDNFPKTAEAVENCNQCKNIDHAHEHSHNHCRCSCEHNHSYEHEHNHEHEHSHEHHHEHEFKSIIITAPELSLDAWKCLFSENNKSLVNGGWCRSKGIIEIENELYTLQWSGQNASFEKYEHSIEKSSCFDEINKIVWIGKIPDSQILETIFNEEI